MGTQPVTFRWPDNLRNRPTFWLCLCSLFLGGHIRVCVDRTPHSISDGADASQTLLDGLKKLRSPGEAGRESDWSRDTPVVRRFSSEEAIFLKKHPGLPLIALHLPIDILRIWLMHHGIHLMRAGKVTGICRWTQRLALTLTINVNGVKFVGQDRQRSQTRSQVVGWGDFKLVCMHFCPYVLIRFKLHLWMFSCQQHV